jgi:general secretion pathway protein N
MALGGYHVGMSMVGWPKVVGFALLVGAATSIGVSPELHAATSATPDILSSDRAEETTSIDVSPVKPLDQPPPNAAKPLQSGNPLWSIPLSVLSPTRERPVFSASRRPPPSAVAAPPAEPVAAPPPPPGPERPALALIGAVVSDSDAIAVFVDRTSQKIVRLRPGETHGGWVLSAVLGREVTLKKADQTETIAIQRQEGAVGGAGIPAPAPAAPAIPASGGFNTSFAPFTPRSTPKNGESDGL